MLSFLGSEISLSKSLSYMIPAFPMINKVKVNIAMSINISIAKARRACSTCDLNIETTKFTMGHCQVGRSFHGSCHSKLHGVSIGLATAESHQWSTHTAWPPLAKYFPATDEPLLGLLSVGNFLVACEQGSARIDKQMQTQGRAESECNFSQSEH